MEHAAAGVLGTMWQSGSVPGAEKRFIITCPSKSRWQKELSQEVLLAGSSLNCKTPQILGNVVGRKWETEIKSTS